MYLVIWRSCFRFWFRLFTVNFGRGGRPACIPATFVLHIVSLNFSFFIHLCWIGQGMLLKWMSYSEKCTIYLWRFWTENVSFTVIVLCVFIFMTCSTSYCLVTLKDLWNAHMYVFCCCCDLLLGMLHCTQQYYMPYWFLIT